MSAVYSVRTTRDELVVSGSDSAMLGVPDEVFVTLGGKPVLNVSALSTFLRDFSEQHAAEIGEVLHHAKWQITADPELIRKIGLGAAGDGCDACQQGVDKALAAVAESGKPILAGTLYWAAPPPPAHTLN